MFEFALKHPFSESVIGFIDAFDDCVVALCCRGSIDDFIFVFIKMQKGEDRERNFSPLYQMRSFR